jgi:hypothetical protein
MKKLVFLFLSLLTAGSLFQACDNSKTYAEMLEDEKNAVNKFIKDNGIRVISLEEFERDTVTASKEAGDEYDEYVAFSNGVYMQIVDRGEFDPADKNKYKFKDRDAICVRYVEEDIMTRDTTCFNVPLEDYMDANQLYTNPAEFIYNSRGSTVYGLFTAQDYYWYNLYQTTAVPSGWLISLPYLRNEAHVRLIVPSKMGHTSAQQYVTPFFYDIRKFEKAK